MKLTKKQAVELSIKKWEFLVENPTKNPENAYPELKELPHNCGLCEKYKYTKNIFFMYCKKCPIRPKIEEYNDMYDVGCRQEGHPFLTWCREKTSENAQAVLDLIKSIKI